MGKHIYDNYYQTENLFGDPYPELIEFFSPLPRGPLLHLGCGHGRDAIPLAEMGFNVTGIDISSVGINQLNSVAESKGLQLKGVVGDIYQFQSFLDFKYVLLDSMFHFLKKDYEREKNLIQRIFNSVSVDTIIVFCIQDAKKKISHFDQIVRSQQFNSRSEINFLYAYKDQGSKHESLTKFKMITFRK